MHSPWNYCQYHLVLLPIRVRQVCPATGLRPPSLHDSDRYIDFGVPAIHHIPGSRHHANAREPVSKLPETHFVLKSQVVVHI